LHARFLKGDRKEPVGERPKGWGWGEGTCKKLTLKKVYGLYGQSRDGSKRHMSSLCIKGKEGGGVISQVPNVFPKMFPIAATLLSHMLWPKLNFHVYIV